MCQIITISISFPLKVINIMLRIFFLCIYPNCGKGNRRNFIRQLFLKDKNTSRESGDEAEDKDIENNIERVEEEESIVKVSSNRSLKTMYIITFSSSIIMILGYITLLNDFYSK